MCAYSVFSSTEGHAEGEEEVGGKNLIEASITSVGRWVISLTLWVLFIFVRRGEDDGRANDCAIKLEH